MGRIGGFVVVAVLLLGLAMAEAAPKTPKPPKVVKPKLAHKCRDKWSRCYGLPLPYCPAKCPSNCEVNCKSCKTVCLTQPPPPPPKIKRSPPPPPPAHVYPPHVYSPPPPVHVYPPHVYSPPPPPAQVYPPPQVSSPPPTPVATPPPPPAVDPMPTPPPAAPVVLPPATPSPPPPAVDPIPSPPPAPVVFPPNTPSPPPAVSAQKRVRCMNKKYPLCYFKEHTCPATCPGTCEVDCVTCRPVCNCDKPGSVCQDPKFTGADGITFYFHGKKERDFCLVTDSNLHINGHFIGNRNDKLKRDFTWVQSLGILFDNHKLYIGAQKTAAWNDAVDRLTLLLDGVPVTLPEHRGASWNSSTSGLTITRTQNTNGVEIEAEGNFKIKAEAVPITEKDSLIHNYDVKDDDCLAHLDLSFKFYSLDSAVNGVLGQTYAANYVSRVKMSVPMPTLGGDDRFSSSSLFSTDCPVARFSGKAVAASDVSQFADLNCAAGNAGLGGVVCKR